MDSLSDASSEKSCSECDSRADEEELTDWISRERRHVKNWCRYSFQLTAQNHWFCLTLCNFLMNASSHLLWIISPTPACPPHSSESATYANYRLKEEKQGKNPLDRELSIKSHKISCTSISRTRWQLEHEINLARLTKNATSCHLAGPTMMQGFWVWCDALAQTLDVLEDSTDCVVLFICVKNTLICRTWADSYSHASEDLMDHACMYKWAGNW
jgi:hypothetical protein